MGLVNSYDSGHFSIPQATACTCCLQKAMYLLHKQLLYLFPTLLVIILKDKLSISNTTARLLLQARAWHTHVKPAAKVMSHLPEPTVQYTLLPSDAQCVSFTKIPCGPDDIKRMTSAHGCHGSDPTGQPLEMRAKESSPWSPAYHPTSQQLLLAASGRSGSTHIPMNGRVKPCYLMILSHATLPKSQKNMQIVYTKPLFSRKRALPPALLLLNRWTTPKIQQ